MNQSISTSVALLFGGASAEHDVSLNSATFIQASLLDAGFQVMLIGIDKSGCWRLAPQIRSPETHWPQVTMLPGSKGQITLASCGSTLDTVDAVFPALHGPLYEDGCLQGALRLANVPFVGPSVSASSNCMDKVMCKKLLTYASLPVAEYMVATCDDLPEFCEVVDLLQLPVFVKPACMGSSIGISRVESAAQYRDALCLAFRYDTKILIERYIEGVEIECALLAGNTIQASVPGSLSPSDDHQFYSYQSKYLDEHGASFSIPAQISEQQADRVSDIAVQACRALACEGMVRVDLFLTDSGDIVINELNTLPGFTRTSMFPKLWEASGINAINLVRFMVDHARTRHEKETQLSQCLN